MVTSYFLITTLSHKNIVIKLIQMENYNKNAKKDLLQGNNDISIITTKMIG